jgi:hypothetical protein
MPQEQPDYYADYYNDKGEGYSPSLEEDPRGYVQQRIEERRQREAEGYSTQDLGDRAVNLTGEAEPGSGFVYGDERDERWKPIEAPVKEVVPPRRREFDYESQSREQRAPVNQPRPAEQHGTGGLF